MMNQKRSMTVELDAPAVGLIDKMLAEGRFANEAEVLRYAMLLFGDWEREQQEGMADVVEKYGIERLRSMIDEGFASGDPIEATDEFFEDVKRRGRERLALARAAE